MTYTFYIPGRLPGMNEYSGAQRSNKYKGAAMKRGEQDRIVRLLKQQLQGVHIDTQVNIYYEFIEPNRKRDKDNISGFAEKVIQDALVEARVLDNDGWKNIGRIVKDYDVSTMPYIKVTLVEVY